MDFKLVMVSTSGAEHIYYHDKKKTLMVMLFHKITLEGLYRKGDILNNNKEIVASAKKGKFTTKKENYDG